MQVHARRVPSFLGGLAVALAASVVLAVIIETGNQAQNLTWSVGLWVCGGVAALATLLAGLVFDRRWLSLRLPLFALLIFGLLAGLFFFRAWQGSA